MTKLPKRFDRAGRDITDLPGLWCEDDLIAVEDYERLRAELAEVQAKVERLKALEQRNFRWAYRLLVGLALRKLEDANKAVGKGVWPHLQSWNDLVPSSRSVFLRQAREEVGIPHDEFLAGIRDGTYDVEDILDEVEAQEAGE